MSGLSYDLTEARADAVLLIVEIWDNWRGWSQSMRRRWRKAHPERLMHLWAISRDACRLRGATAIAIAERIEPARCPLRWHP